MGKVTPEMKARMQELRTQGLAYWKIGKTLNVSSTTVKCHLNPSYKASMDKYKSEWFKLHSKYNKEHSNRWYKLHPEQATTSIRNSRRRFRLKVIAKLGGKCSKCGSSDYRVLQIHHIYGQGRTERARYPDSSSFYRSLLRGGNTDGLSLLCGNCNWVYDYEAGLRSKTPLHLKVLELLGNKCEKCGNEDTRVLQVNHLRGGGGKEWQSNHRQLYKAIVEGSRCTNDLNILCVNCNTLYSYERNREKEST